MSAFLLAIVSFTFADKPCNFSASASRSLTVLKNASASAYSSLPKKTSITFASCPFFLKALHTLVDVTIETSLSVLVPPVRTAIFITYLPLCI